MGDVESNFGFMLAQWPALAQRARKAEQFAFIDPRTSMFYARHTAEHLVDWLYEAEPSIPMPYKPDLDALTSQPEFRAVVGPVIGNKLDAIRKMGNRAVHDKQDPSPLAARQAVSELFHVCYWLARTYTVHGSALPPEGQQFNAELLAPRLKPGIPAPKPQSAEQVSKLAAELAASDKALAAAKAESADLQRQILTLQIVVKAAKERNSAVPDHHDYDESLTRAYLIDADLHDAGWRLESPEDREFVVTGMPNATGVGKVDYVLWGADGLPLAVVEAKRTTRDAHNGKQQAKLYADALERQFGRRPVIYYTNGYEHWLWDDSSYSERQVQGFHTRDELDLMVARRRTRRALAAEPIDNNIAERSYQHAAIRAVTESLELKSRKQLIVMATGTGKTRTAVALSKLLMDANWAKRILFLADRVALVDQAVKAFKTHLPGSAPTVLGGGEEAESRIHLATYPTIMNLIAGQAGGTGQQFGVGYYDLIIVDEAHRSIYQKYRAIFRHFDALLVGLTATPQSEVDRNTYSMFDIEDNVPTFAYELDEATAAGYLVPPRVVPIPLKFPYEGIRYDNLSDAEKDEWDALEWDDDDVIPDAVDPAVVNSWLFNTDTVNKVLEVLMTRGHKVAGGDRLGKTIIFAKNNDHAKFIAAQFDKNYPQLKGHFAQVITYQVNYARSLIEDFGKKESNPHIAISVDMLDTGIDVPEVLNLVFFKMVRSKTKFWQMVGRGTRLCTDLYGPGEDKQDFFIFDVCRNVEFFNANMKGNEGSVGRSLAEATFGARAKLLRAATRAGLAHSLATDLVQTLSGQVGRLPFNNFLVKPHRADVEKYTQADSWAALSEGDVASLETGLARIAGLGSPAEKEEAKRFDLMVLNAQLTSLEDPGAVGYCRRKIQDIAAALADQPNNPAITPQLQLLEQIADNHGWESVSVEWLESVRRKLRGLVHLIEKKRRTVVYTNFEDELGELAEVALKGVHSGVNDFSRYQVKVQTYLRAHLDLATLQRLRRNKPLTEMDLTELERILQSSGAGTEEDLTRAREEGLSHFVRSLVGLDRSAVEEALSEFISGSVLTAAQLDFLKVLTTQLTENGSVPIGALYESPYSELAPTGSDELFGDDRLDRLELVLRTFDDGLMVG